jgi:hypothetical protein
LHPTERGFSVLRGHRAERQDTDRRDAGAEKIALDEHSDPNEELADDRANARAARRR